jgi:hypothetical protein
LKPVGLLGRGLGELGAFEGDVGHFYYLCQLGMRTFLDFLAGFRPPAANGEYLLFTPGGGGLLMGSVFRAPFAGALFTA